MREEFVSGWINPKLLRKTRTVSYFPDIFVAEAPSDVEDAYATIVLGVKFNQQYQACNRANRTTIERAMAIFSMTGCISKEDMLEFDRMCDAAAMAPEEYALLKEG